MGVGDSPWLWRKNQLTRINQDHSYRPVLAQQLAGGEISATDAQVHPIATPCSALTGDVIERIDLSRNPPATQPIASLSFASLLTQ
ncbi:MAG: hypothetical protein R3F37_14040 [Candidatus Competibacteraceae bacterium]